MAEQKRESIFETLPKLKASAVPRIRESRQIRISRIISVCNTAIEEYHLDQLVRRAKERDGFRSLSDFEKDSLCAGLIKLGEALTFCKDGGNQLLRDAGIIRPAEWYVDARNYFVHHHMYHSHLDWHNETQRCMASLPFINTIVEKLRALEACGLETLTKPVRKGQNDFSFKYETFVNCLKIEFAKLERILTTNNLLDEITSNVAIKASLENRIRNILSIMVDSIDKDSINKNIGKECLAEKKAVAKFNELFCFEFKDFTDIFIKLNGFRNALCHIDESLEKPYMDVRGMLAFAKRLEKMHSSGYVDRLDRQLQEVRKEESGNQAELSIERLASVVSSSSSSAFQAPSSQSDEGKRKVKIIATPAAQTAKSAAAAAATPLASSASVFRLLPEVYNSDSDEESKNASKDKAQTDRPKMGRR